VAVAWLVLLPGCFISRWFAEAPPPKKPPDVGELPDDIPSLMDLADSQLEKASSRTGLIRAVAALEKAEDLLGERPSTVEPTEVQIRLARAAFLISETEDDPTEKLVWITKGEDAAEAVRRARPDRVEGHYYLAVLKGRRVEQGGLSGIVKVHGVENLGLEAAEIDPSFEDGGPYRLLAMLYAKTPPWPTSIGDVDLALEYAEKAIAISDYPLNHLIMAEVLIEEEEFARAREELRRVLAAPKQGKWAREGEQWRPYARGLLNQLESETE
jgi:hypothetical protein